MNHLKVAPTQVKLIFIFILERRHSEPASQMGDSGTIIIAAACSRMSKAGTAAINLQERKVPITKTRVIPVPVISVNKERNGPLLSLLLY